MKLLKDSVLISAVLFPIMASALQVTGRVSEFSPDGSSYVMLETFEHPNEQSRVVIRQTKTGEIQKAFTLMISDQDSYSIPVDAHFSPDGKKIAMTDLDSPVNAVHVIKIYDVNSGMLLQEIGAAEKLETISAFSFNPEGTRIYATVGYWNKVKNFYVWDLNSGNVLMTPYIPEQSSKDFPDVGYIIGAWGVMPVPEMGMIVSKGWWGIDLWSDQSGKYLLKIGPYGMDSLTILMPDHQHVFVASMGGINHILDLHRFTSKKFFLDYEPRAIAFSQDARTAIMGPDDDTGKGGMVEKIDLSDLDHPKTIWKNDSYTSVNHSSARVSSIVLTPDGKHALVSHVFGYTRYMDTDTGKVEYEFGKPK